jgi:uncharacterized protein (TIGR03032 family)
MQDNVNQSFITKYDEEVSDLLYREKISLCITTYQAGKFIFLSPKNSKQLIQLPRNFEKPMGFGFNEYHSKLAIASKDSVTVFSASKELAYFYPNKPKVYDVMFLPRITYHTSALDLHDLHFGNKETLYAINTLFSCIVILGSDYNFTPFWFPPQIDDLVSEDRCHLNGMAMLNGKPKYASAFNTGNSPKSWKDTITTAGVIWDVETNQLIAENLPMPHSPRIHKDDLYVLLSATGELVKIHPKGGTYEEIIKINGFVRGLSFHGNYAFIGLSKLRKNSSTFSKIEFSHTADISGVVIVDMTSKKIVGQINYLTSVDEIYDVHVLPNKIRPNILNTLTDDYKKALMIPNATYWRHKENLKND